MKIGLKPIAWLFVSIMMMLGVTGCMFNSEKQMTGKMMDYLEEKYGGTYEKEFYEKGSTLFPDMYGGAKMMVHPVGQPDLPFYVFKGTSSEGFNDDYPLCYFSYHYTEKYKHEIERLDERDLIVRFALGFAERPQEAEILRTPIDEFVGDKDREGSLLLYVAVPVEGDRLPEDDSSFLTSVYYKMKELTDRDFIVFVAYVQQENYQDAVEAARLAFSTNFSWKFMRAGLLQAIHFRQSAGVSDPLFFNKLLKEKW